MALNPSEYKQLQGFEAELMQRVSRASTWMPGSYGRIQIDASKIMCEASLCPEGTLSKWKLRLQRAIAEALEWEREQVRQHANASVQILPTEKPGVEAYLVTLPDSTPCTALALESAATLLGVDHKTFEALVWRAHIPAYHVVPSTYEEDPEDSRKRYVPSLYLYAWHDLESLYRKHAARMGW